MSEFIENEEVVNPVLIKNWMPLPEAPEDVKDG